MSEEDSRAPPQEQQEGDIAPKTEDPNAPINIKVELSKPQVGTKNATKRAFTHPLPHIIRSCPHKERKCSLRSKGVRNSVSYRRHMHIKLGRRLAL